MSVLRSLCLLACLSGGLALQGCSSMLPEPDFVAADPESLNEWMVEGQVTIKNASGKQKAYFEYRQIDGEYQMSLRPESPVGKTKAVISGYEGEAEASLEVIDPEARDLAQAVQESLPMDSMGFWLRALPATDRAELTQDDDIVSEIQESGWSIEYDNYMQVSNYRLPDQISLQKKKTSVEMALVRAETGFLSSPCPADFDIEASKQGTTPALTSAYAVAHADTRPYGAAVSELVPRSGQAPLPRWIDDLDFCTQLFKVHGRIPDPRIGLYGPDSMMWRITGPLTPAGMGAGRALLLQTAHPWITAGIDEHSIVRYDPLERARRTFIHISTMVYGSMPQVMASANLVHGIHKEIKGKMPYDAGSFHKSSEYRANEVAAMVWVSATLWDTLVRMYEGIEEPLTYAEKEQLYEEAKLFNMLFGIPEEAMPRNWKEFADYNETMWLSPQLTVTDNARILKEDLFKPGSIFLAFPLWVQEVVTAANLPPSIREGYEMDYGLWERINYAWILPAAKVYNWVLPKGMGYNPVYHEAQARLKGERVGWYQQSLIKAAGVERLVN